MMWSLIMLFIKCCHIVKLLIKTQHEVNRLSRWSLKPSRHWHGLMQVCKKPSFSISTINRMFWNVRYWNSSDKLSCMLNGSQALAAPTFSSVRTQHNQCLNDNLKLAAQLWPSFTIFIEIKLIILSNFIPQPCIYILWQGSSNKT